MKLKDELYKIVRKETTDNGGRYLLELLPHSLIYQAHFPEQPITPGVCIIQICQEVLTDFLGEELMLAGAKNVKFLSVLSPWETTAVWCEITRITREDKETKAQFTVMQDGTTYAKLSLTLRR